MRRNRVSISIIVTCLIGVAFCEKEAGNSSRDESLTVLSEVTRKFELSSIVANLEKEDPHQSLELLERYLKGKWLEARKAIRYINRVAELHPQPEVRQKVVDLLVKYYSDHNIGHRCYEYLLRDYQADDFSEYSKDIIRKYLNEENLSAVSSWDIRLSGIANLQGQIPRLNEIILEDTKNREHIKPFLDKVHWRHTKTFDIRLAKARMGVKEDVKYCVSKIKEDVDNNPRFPVFLLNNLGYIRQPESVELLKDYFLSERKIPGTEVEEPFSNYLMPIMRQNLMGFPELRDIELLRSSPPEQIKVCKDWVKSQTEFNIKR